MLENAGVAEYIMQRMGLSPLKQPDWTEWSQLVERVRQPHARKSKWRWWASMLNCTMPI